MGEGFTPNYNLEEDSFLVRIFGFFYVDAALLEEAKKSVGYGIKACEERMTEIIDDAREDLRKNRLGTGMYMRLNDEKRDAILKIILEDPDVIYKDPEYLKHEERRRQLDIQLKKWKHRLLTEEMKSYFKEAAEIIHELNLAKVPVRYIWMLHKNHIRYMRGEHDWWNLSADEITHPYGSIEQLRRKRDELIRKFGRPKQ